MFRWMELKFADVNYSFVFSDFPQQQLSCFADKSYKLESSAHHAF
jgi:hypothetical protein